MKIEELEDEEIPSLDGLADQVQALQGDVKNEERKATVIIGDQARQAPTKPEPSAGGT